MMPSACSDIAAAWTPVLTPTPTPTGRSVVAFVRAMSGATPSAVACVVPVTPMMPVA